MTDRWIRIENRVKLRQKNTKSTSFEGKSPVGTGLSA
jgi:hypothetical protein